MKRGHGELFRVDRRSGQISLKQTVDAHNQLYALVIAAFDGGVPACGAEAAVAVRVWGGGAAPAWERAHYVLEAREDAAPGAPLAPPLRARSPLNRQLIYTLLDDADDMLEIHFDTGKCTRAPSRSTTDFKLRPFGCEYGTVLSTEPRQCISRFRIPTFHAVEPCVGLESAARIVRFPSTNRSVLSRSPRQRQ